MTINVIIGSKNPVKVKAAEIAFTRLFSNDKIAVKSINTSSEVSDMPLSDKEMINGAKNRALNCLKEKDEDTNFTIGIEGGIHINDSLTFDHSKGFLRAWIAVYSIERSSMGIASTITINLPSIVLNEVLSGKELKDVIDNLENRNEINKKEGAFGILTKGHISRMDTFIQAIYAAVAPFYNSMYDM